MSLAHTTTVTAVKYNMGVCLFILALESVKIQAVVAVNLCCFSKASCNKYQYIFWGMLNQLLGQEVCQVCFIARV